MENNNKIELKCLDSCCKIYYLVNKEIPQVWLPKEEWAKLNKYFKKDSKDSKDSKDDWNIITNNKITKAGTFIFDKKTNKLLIIHVKGGFWGCPKGGIEKGETYKNCAVRETYEETGIKINEILLNKSNKIKNCMYYDIEMEESKTTLSINTNDVTNDTNGIGWINIECLQKLVQKNIIKVNKHLKLLIYKKFNISITYINQ
jgi:8-oxo-dGTP pyrophosphatase MutT (NUDIX family)